MRIFILFIVIFFISQPINAQKIETVEIDKFTGVKRIETSYVTIASKFSAIVRMQLISLDSKVYIIIAGNNWAVGLVSPSDPSIFLFEDSSKIKIYPTSIQSYEVNYGTTSTYHHRYSLTRDELKILSEKKVVAFRREYDDYYADIDVNERNSKRIKALATGLLEKL